MRRSTAFLTAAALAIGGIALPTEVFSQQRNQNSTSGTSSGREGITSSSRTGHEGTAGESGRHMGEVKGVQDLFARATDAAVSENGMSQLTELFATREGKEGHEGQSGSRSGLSGSERSGTSGQTSTSSERSRTSGTSGTTGTERARTGAGEATGSARTGAAAGGAENQQLAQIVQQIRQEWKQKYNQDFRITNESVVYSDITAADIGMREAQPAGGELRGTNSGASGESRDLSGDRRGSGLSGSSSDRSGTSGSSATGTGTSTGADHSGSYSKNDRTSSSASGSASSDSQRSSRTGSSELSGSAQQAGEREMHHPMTVNVPAVRGTQAVQVHLIREGGEFKFASHQQVDQRKLSQALEKHLGEVQSSKSDWPSDVNQGYRFVTQHVLMAINDATGHMGESGEHAQPAGSRIHGTGSDTSGTSSGSTGTSSSGSSSGSSNTTGTGSRQNR